MHAHFKGRLPLNTDRLLSKHGLRWKHTCNGYLKGIKDSCESLAAKGPLATSCNPFSNFQCCNPGGQKSSSRY